MVTIEIPEEKGTDVNMGVHIVRDGFMDEYDCAVVVSNDSDLAEAMKIARYDCGKIVGWMPHITPNAYKKKRFVSEFNRLAHFKKEIRTRQLRDAQLPNPIPGTNIIKPTSW